MHFTPLEILPFKTYDSLVLSIFAVCGPQSSLSSECSEHSRKKPHTHWLAARARLPWPRPGNRGFAAYLCGAACSGRSARTEWALRRTPSPLAWLLSVFLSCFPFSESILFIVF